MSICLLGRFKNERHIMYEFISHYLLEGIDCIFLIDHNSNDKFYDKNKFWLKDLINRNKVNILKSQSDSQENDYNFYLHKIKSFKWAIFCDLDEFMFSVPENTTIKTMLNNELSKYEYIKIFWKLFTHKSKFQPKSVINDNLYTHFDKVDKSSKSLGIKCIAKTKNLKHIYVHYLEFSNKPNVLKLYNCHNKFIQNNHYRTQSDEYLFGVKEERGGGVNKNKYKNFKRHTFYYYQKKCDLLKNKRKDLISKILVRNQIRPKLYKNSSFYKEIKKLKRKKNNQEKLLNQN